MAQRLLINTHIENSCPLVLDHVKPKSGCLKTRRDESRPTMDHTRKMHFRGRNTEHCHWRAVIVKRCASRGELINKEEQSIRAQLRSLTCDAMLGLQATSNKHPRNVHEKRRETSTHALATLCKNVSYMNFVFRPPQRHHSK